MVSRFYLVVFISFCFLLSSTGAVSDGWLATLGKLWVVGAVASNIAKESAVPCERKLSNLEFDAGMKAQAQEGAIADLGDQVKYKDVLLGSCQESLSQSEENTKITDGHLRTCEMERRALYYEKDHQERRAGRKNQKLKRSTAEVIGLKMQVANLRKHGEFSLVNFPCKNKNITLSTGQKQFVL